MSSTALRNLVTPWHVVPAALVVVLSIAVAESPIYGLAAMAALLVLILTVQHPAAVLAVALLVAQEIRPGGGRFGGLTSIGHQAYFLGPVPAIAALAVVAAVIVVARGGWPRMTAGGTAILTAAVLLAGVAAVRGLHAGQSTLAALNQTARPFLLLVCGLLVGAGVRSLRGEHRTAARSVAVTVVVLALAGALAVAAGQSADPSVSPLFIFYDSAMSAAAGAVLLAVLFSRTGGRLGVVVAFAALLIVVVGFRRNVWLAVAVALLAALLVSRSRRRGWAALAVAAVPAAAALAAFPGVAASLGARATDAWYTINGEAGEASTRGHVRDIEIGWRYVGENPWGGVGPEAPQLTGLVAAESSRVYVHNEWLLDWLRFGMPGVFLAAVLTVVMAGMALRTVRRSDADVVDLSAAMFLLIAPVSMMTAPFLSTTSRWPLLIGLAAGVLASTRALVKDDNATDGIPSQGSEDRGVRAVSDRA